MKENKTLKLFTICVCIILIVSLDMAPTIAKEKTKNNLVFQQSSGTRGGSSGSGSTQTPQEKKK